MLNLQAWRNGSNVYRSIAVPKVTKVSRAIPGMVLLQTWLANPHTTLE